MFCKMICPVQLPSLTISIQASYKWAFAGSGTFQILPPVSDHQIRTCIFPNDFLHNLCLWTESIRFASHKNDRTIVPSQIPSSAPHDRKLYSCLRSQDDIPRFFKAVSISSAPRIPHCLMLLICLTISSPTILLACSL